MSPIKVNYLSLYISALVLAPLAGYASGPNPYFPYSYSSDDNVLGIAESGDNETSTIEKVILLFFNDENSLIKYIGAESARFDDSTNTWSILDGKEVFFDKRNGELIRVIPFQIKELVDSQFGLENLLSNAADRNISLVPFFGFPQDDGSIEPLVIAMKENEGVNLMIAKAGKFQLKENSILSLQLRNLKFSTIKSFYQIPIFLDSESKLLELRIDKSIELKIKSDLL